VNHGRAAQRLSSASAPLYGVGVTQGYSVSLPNVGGQWENSFTRPALSVQVVDSTAAGAQETLDGVLSNINTAASGLQDQFGVEAGALIRAVPVTPESTISYVGRTRSQTLRAALTLGLVIDGLAVLVTFEVDRLLQLRQSHPPAAAVMS
jgi:hypothetical protein